MSILIKGMEMPKSCFECFAFNAENTYCALYSHGIPARHNLKPYEKPEWCELIEEPPESDDSLSCGIRKNIQQKSTVDNGACSADETSEKVQEDG